MDVVPNLAVVSNGKQHDLEAPLLLRRRDGGAAEEEEASGTTTTLSELVAEGKKQLGLGLPVAAMGLMNYILFSVSLAFVGRLGAVHFAGAAMASSFANVFGYAILDGMSAGMETFGGQAHGAGQALLLGVVMQRGIFVLVLAAVPISVIFTFASPILLYLGQDPAIVELASAYVLVLIPGLFAAACLSPVQKFFEVQGVMLPLAAGEFAVLLLAAPVNYLWIHVLGLGYLGAAAAYSTATCLNLAFLVLYLQLEPTGILSRAWPGWSTAAFRDWLPFLKLAVPAMAMNVFEWWFFEVLLVMAGWLPRPDLALSAMNITYQTCGVCYMVFLGLSTAASVRVSNELGAQRPASARRAVVVAIVDALLCGGVLSVVMLLFRNEWALIFTAADEVDVIGMVAQLMPLLVVSQMGLSVSAVLSGVLRGSGQQLAGSVVNGVSLWGVALPACYYLAFHEQRGLTGLWWGLMAGVALQTLMNVGLAWKTDWAYQAARAFERVG